MDRFFASLCIYDFVINLCSNTGNIMKDKYDVVVIGAGPIGGYVAGNISKVGYNVAIIEQQRSIGSHLGCAGLITSRIFEYLKINMEEVIQNNIKGANIHSPEGKASVQSSSL